MYNRNFRSRIVLLIILLLYNSTYCTGKLLLFNVNGEELGSFDTVDFMWINSAENSYPSKNGSLIIGEFLSDQETSTPCILRQPPSTIGNITVLLVRFDQVLTNCSSYEDVIQSNEWLRYDPKDHVPDKVKASLSPMIIIFTSTNDGDPGIRERYSGNINTLSRYKPKLVLMEVSDAMQISDLMPRMSYVEFIPDSGPWLKLLQSKQWKSWSILFGIFYSFIITLSFSSFVLAIKNYKFKLTNPRLWLFTTIIIYTIIFLAMLEYDPWSIRFNYLSDLEYEVIATIGYYVLCLSYTIYLFPWIKATRNLTEVVNYNRTQVRSLSRIFQCGAVIAILIKTTSIIFYLLQFSPMKIEMNVLRVIFTLFDSLFCLIVTFTFGTFGFIIFSARTYEKASRRRRREHRPGARKSLRREIILSVILTIAIVISLLFLTLQKIIMSYLPITVGSFWVVRITDDIANVLSSLVLIAGLYSNTIGKYSHMIYNGSSDEDITTSTASRDSISRDPSRESSLHDVNGVGDISNVNSNNNNDNYTYGHRRKRSTLEILFGRNSLGL